MASPSSSGSDARLSDAGIRQVLERIDDAVLVVDREHRVVFANQVFRSRFGLPRSEERGRVDVTRLHPGGHRGFEEDAFSVPFTDGSVGRAWIFRPTAPAASNPAMAGTRFGPPPDSGLGGDAVDRSTPLRGPGPSDAHGSPGVEVAGSACAISARQPTVLVAMPPGASRDILLERLTRAGLPVRTADDARQAWMAWCESGASVVLVDGETAPRSVMALIERIQGHPIAHGQAPRWVVRIASASREIVTVLGQRAEAVVPSEDPDRVLAAVGRVIGRPVILVVDDQPDVRLIVSRVLGRSGRYLPIDVGSIQRSRDLLSTETFAAVISDLYVDDSDGLTLAREVRADDRHADTQLVALTAARDRTRACCEAGFQAVLRKPIVASELCAAIDILLAPAPPAATVEIDPDIADLVPIFLDNRRREVDELPIAIADRQHDRVYALGHKMKGSGSAYGFHDLSRWGDVIERAAQAQDAMAALRATRQLRHYLDRVDIRIAENGRSASNSA